MNSYKNQKICLKEFINEKSSDIRIVLTKDFQNRIFSELIDNLSAIELAQKLNTSRPMIYHYRNYRTDNISLEMLNKMMTLMNLSEEEVKKSIINVFKNQDAIKNCLDLGREFRINQLKNFKDEIPKLNEIIEDNYLNLEKWLSYYQKINKFWM